MCVIWEHNRPCVSVALSLCPCVSVSLCLHGGTLTHEHSLTCLDCTFVRCLGFRLPRRHLHTHTPPPTPPPCHPNPYSHSYSQPQLPPVRLQKVCLLPKVCMCVCVCV